jgi:regulator of nucleoside diphosphate kinase
MSTQSFDNTNQRPRIVIPASEHARLMALADKAEQRAPEIAEYLADELTRADIVPDDKFDANVVRMGSRVTYLDESTGKERTVTLVYPEAADVNRGLISVLTPIGAALLGMSPSQTITWPNPGGRNATLKVLSVEQPPAEDDAQAS